MLGSCAAQVGYIFRLIQHVVFARILIVYRFQLLTRILYVVKAVVWEELTLLSRSHLTLMET